MTVVTRGLAAHQAMASWAMVTPSPTYFVTQKLLALHCTHAYFSPSFSSFKVVSKNPHYI